MNVILWILVSSNDARSGVRSHTALHVNDSNLTRVTSGILIGNPLDHLFRS